MRLVNEQSMETLPIHVDMKVFLKYGSRKERPWIYTGDEGTVVERHTKTLRRTTETLAPESWRGDGYPSLNPFQRQAVPYIEQFVAWSNYATNDPNYTATTEPQQTETQQ